MSFNETHCVQNNQSKAKLITEDTQGWIKGKHWAYYDLLCSDKYREKIKIKTIISRIFLKRHYNLLILNVFVGHISNSWSKICSTIHNNCHLEFFKELISRFMCLSFVCWLLCVCLQRFSQLHIRSDPALLSEIK